MIKQLEIIFLLFFIYSFLGWAMEIFNTFRVEKKFINRGFLIGPYCPIYGFGVILITFLLKKYENDIIATFIFSIIICGILEYVTSYLLEKIFNARWWDYSKRKYNINGRICLENLIIFGILGCFIIYILNPFFINIFNSFPDIVLHIISILLFVIILTDTIISGNVILKLKGISKNIKKDDTEEITEKVRSIIQNKFFLQKRFLKAFPNIKKSINFEELVQNAKRKVEKLKTKVK